MKDMFVGTPVVPEYFYENGIENALDEMKQEACINNVLVYSQSYQFRQYRPNFAIPTDSQGREKTDVFVRVNEEFYSKTTMRQVKNEKALYADRDILDELSGPAAERGISVYARILEPYVITGAVPGMEKCAEVDARGAEYTHVCFNHPDYIAWWEAVVADLVHSHPSLQGFKFGQERGGPLMRSIGGSPGTCFCEFCEAKARQLGINVSKAKLGMIALADLGNAITKDNLQPADGFLVSFMRLLFEYPEVLAWEKMWMDSREEQRRRMYSQIKSIRPEMQVGWHICHGMTWDLITRATWDYAKMSDHSDWLSSAVYFDSFGRRSMNHYKNNYAKRLFADVTPDISYPMFMSLLGLNPSNEPSLEQLEAQDLPMSSDYVYNETRRAVLAVAGKTKIYSRIGFDMPGYHSGVTPQQVRENVARALQAGADGLFCGREWEELAPANRQAFGDALRDMK